MSLSRKFIFANNEIYHVFNRGVERRPIFETSFDYKRLLKTIDYYQFNPQLSLSAYLNLSSQQREIVNKSLSPNERLIDIVAFCFMPNHFHLLLKQQKEGGIEKYLSNIQNSYTKFFNLKRERVGPLLQGVFKAVLIETTEQLLYVSRYIHLNPIKSNLISTKNISQYPWSSLNEYSSDKRGICQKEVLLNNYSSKEQYLEFVLDQMEDIKGKEKIDHLLLE